MELGLTLVYCGHTNREMLVNIYEASEMNLCVYVFVLESLCMYISHL